jgi:hypothetical protein
MVAVLALAALACTPPPAAPTVPTSPKQTVAEAFPGLTPDEPFRATEPPPEASKTWPPPKLFASRLANGMQLIVLERHQPPLVAAELIVRGGFAGHPQASPVAISLATESTRCSRSSTASTRS